MPRGASNVGGLRNIRTMHSMGKRFIPRVAHSAYLDLYMLRKEKERLEKEDAILEKRKAGIQKRLDNVKKEVEVLESSAQKEKEGHGEVVKEESQEKKWKRMTLNY